MTPKFPPGPTGIKLWQLVGNVGKGDQRRLDLLDELVTTHGDIVHVHILGTHYYLVNTPEAIQSVLVKNAEHFQSQKLGQKPSAKSYDSATLALEKADHRRIRRIIQPAFTPTRVADYAPIMTAYTQELLTEWQAQPHRNIVDDMTALTLRIVSRCLFNADVTDSADAFGEVVRQGTERLSGVDKTPIWLPIPKNFSLWKAWMKMDGYIKEVIAQRRNRAQDYDDLLAKMLTSMDSEDGTGLTDEEAHGMAISLFIAGHETTANLMIWAFALLAQSPLAYQSLQLELASVLGGRIPNATDLAQLPYTMGVIREALRLYPPAWVMTRYASETTELAGYSIPKGSIILMSPYLMGRNATYYDSPLEFKPERWLDGLEKKLPPYAFFPFGGGAHVCVGQYFSLLEAPLILATIGQAWQAHLQSDAKIEVQPLITLRPAGAVTMNVKPIR